MKKETTREQRQAQINLVKMAIDFLLIERLKNTFRGNNRDMATDIIEGLKAVYIELNEELNTES